MLFNSIEFLFLFLPASLLGFFVLQNMGARTAIMAWLVGCSLVFYGWWNPIYLPLLALSAIFNYLVGKRLSLEDKLRGKCWLWFGVLFNLGLLAYFKYANFFVEAVSTFSSANFNFQNIILPLAISFYTFQQITYLVDANRGKIQPHTFLEYCLFVSFFPQLIAGPIVHHSEMLEQFKRLTDRGQRVQNLVVGASILIIGLFKKVVLADTFAQFATPVFALSGTGYELSATDALTGSLSYAFQLYFDFSGYSDMAIGLACMFGLRLPVNFFSPYRAQNISDFWRMWHATLSRFLRDYVYSGLGGFMCSPRRQRFNLFATMFLGGVWHGAGWTFLVYGLCHGFYVVAHQIWRVRVSGPLGLVGRPSYRALAQILTFLVVVLTLVVFRAETLTEAANIYSSLLTWEGLSFSPSYLATLESIDSLAMTSRFLGDAEFGTLISVALLIALLLCWLFPSTYQLFRSLDIMIEKPLAGREPVLKFSWTPSAYWAAFIGVLLVASLMNLTQVSEFLYFQF
ncbi:MAG: MBOAT family protein [Pseudomonadales bacterium]